MDESSSHSNGIVEVKFAVSDPTYPFVGITREENCRVELEKMLPRESSEYAEFFTIVGADPDRVLELASATDLVEPQLVTSYENSGLFEFVVEGFCPARDLAELGAIPQEVVAEDGEGYLVGEIPPGTDVPELVDSYLAAHPSVNLVSKQTKERSTPLFTTEELQRAVDERLTDRQRELLLAAYDAGYYQRPSETTGEELADEFGISNATLSQHLRVAERKLVSLLVQDDIL